LEIKAAFFDYVRQFSINIRACIMPDSSPNFGQIRW
jgi:hypothetical protein